MKPDIKTGKTNHITMAEEIDEAAVLAAEAEVLAQEAARLAAEAETLAQEADRLAKEVEAAEAAARG